MKMSNNQFGRLQLLIEELSHLLYLQNVSLKVTERDYENFAIKASVLFKHPETNLLSGQLKDIWNRGKDVEINSVKEG